MDKTIKENCEILNNVQSSIKSFDNKAGILISIIGIVFGLSLYFLNTLDSLNQLVLSNLISNTLYQSRYLRFSTLFILYLVSAVLSIISCLFVIYPRKNKSNNVININYYLDLYKMSYEEFINNKKLWKDNEEIIWNQIQYNSDICRKKHIFLIISMLLFVAFLFLFIALVIMHICFMRY